MIFFQLANWKKNCFEPKKLVYFSTFQTEKKSWTKLGKTSDEFVRYVEIQDRWQISQMTEKSWSPPFPIVTIKNSKFYVLCMNYTYWHYQIIIIVSQAWPHFTSLLTAENLYFAIKMKLEIFIFVNLVLLFSSVHGNTRDVDGVCVTLHCGLQATACALDGDCSKVSLFCFVFEDYFYPFLWHSIIHSPIISFERRDFSLGKLLLVTKTFLFVKQIIGYN